MTAPNPDIICFGEPMVEFTELPNGDFRRGIGGDTTNTAVAAARQGASVGVLTALGADDPGDAILRLLETERVDAGRVIRNPTAKTAIFFVYPSPSGRNFNYYRSGSAASLIQPSDIPEDYVAGAKVLHVSGISQAISPSACDAVFHAMEIARAAGTLVSYDSNLRLSLWPKSRARAVIRESIRQCDIAFPSVDDTTELTGESDPDRIVDDHLSAGAKIVALKLGAEGCLVATAQERLRLRPHRVDPIDATGAGDTFAGAFLASYVAHGDAFRSARYANAAAALTTTGYGSITPIPDRVRVEKLMEFETVA